MDFLDTSLMFPTVATDPVAPFRLKRKRGPAQSDRREEGLDDPLLDGSAAAGGQAVSLLGRVRRFVGLCLWPAGGSEMLVPTDQEDQGLLSRLVGSLRRTVRVCCETIINGFVWSAQARPY